MSNPKIKDEISELRDNTDATAHELNVLRSAMADEQKEQTRQDEEIKKLKEWMEHLNARHLHRDRETKEQLARIHADTNNRITELEIEVDKKYKDLGNTTTFMIGKMTSVIDIVQRLINVRRQR